MINHHFCKIYRDFPMFFLTFLGSFKMCLGVVIGPQEQLLWIFWIVLNAPKSVWVHVDMDTHVSACTDIFTRRHTMWVYDTRFDVVQSWDVTCLNTHTHTKEYALRNEIVGRELNENEVQEVQVMATLTESLLANIQFPLQVMVSVYHDWYMEHLAELAEPDFLRMQENVRRGIFSNYILLRLQQGEKTATESDETPSELVVTKLSLDKVRIWEPLTLVPFLICTCIHAYHTVTCETKFSRTSHRTQCSHTHTAITPHHKHHTNA